MSNRIAVISRPGAMNMGVTDDLAERVRNIFRSPCSHEVEEAYVKVTMYNQTVAVATDDWCFLGPDPEDGCMRWICPKCIKTYVNAACESVAEENQLDVEDLPLKFE